jgi:putative spermidine/putrescine transport system substrate-binding protein
MPKVNLAVRTLVLVALVVAALVSAGTADSSSKATSDAGDVDVAALGGATQAVLESLAPEFKKETGYNLVVVPQVASANVLASLQASQANPTIDVAELDYGVALEGVAQHLFEPVTPKQVPNLRQLYKSAQVAGGALTGYGAFGIVYDPQAFAANHWKPPTSWRDLFLPQFAHKVVLSDSTLSFGPLLALEFAQLNGGSIATIRRGYSLLRKVAPNVVAWDTAVTQYSQLFESGQAVIGVWSNLGSQSEKAKGVPMQWVLPKEGGFALPEWAGVVKNAPNPQGALAWLNFRISPVAEAAFAVAENYGPTNAKLKLPANVSQRVIYGPAAVKKLQNLDWNAFNVKRPAVATYLAQSIQTIH